MKKILLFLLNLICVYTTQAQNTGRFDLSGTMVDTMGIGMPEATVMLLLPKDSSLVNFGRTNKEGNFEFKGLKRTPYFLKVTYVGYLPFQLHVDPMDKEKIELGKQKMAFLNQDLYEVIIKTARAPLSIRGDTIEYDPRSFKVPPGSSVEELLRRLPGMQVEQDGSITAQGEAVKRVTVDGKRFFGDDTKAATKNLPAEAIDKVQVFNDKTEQSRITGVDDGKHEKTLNLLLKDSHKKGGFGKATAAVGTDKRLAGKINYNRFNDKNQFSVIGLGNNTNSGGMSWDDYQDFKGSQSFNWSDDGDFGFGGGRYVSFGGDDESLTIQAGSGGQNRGFNKNIAGGANYNFDTKKTKFNTSYYYNQNKQDLDASSRQQSFLSNTTFSKLDTNSRFNFNQNHRAGLRFEKNIDSLNTIIILSNIRFGSGNNDYSSHQQFYRGEVENGRPATISDMTNTSDFNSFAIGNTAIYRHKFLKKGRNFAASLGYNVNNANGYAAQQSLNKFILASAEDSTVAIHQTNDTKSLRNQIKASVLFIEPISKKFVLETFYNYSLKSDDVDRNVFDISESAIRNVNLSRYYINKTDFNRVGTSLRYSHNGLNIAGGLAFQQIQMNGKFAAARGDGFTSALNRKFVNWTPNASLNYDLKSNRYLWAGYQMNVNEPNISQLQPIVNNSNPLYITVGNPNLVPTVVHNGNLGFNYFNPSSFTRMYIGLNYSYYLDQVIFNQTVDENLVTTTKAGNISGGENLSFYGNYGFPIVKTKSNMSFNLNYSLGSNLTYINGALNTTNTIGYNFGLRTDFTPSDKFTLYANANWNISDTKYSISKTQNQKIVNGTYSAEMNFKMPKDIYFNSGFNYNTYVNKRYGFNQNMPILNISVYKTMLKSKKGEVRLSMYDVFNQNRGISQYAYSNFVTQEKVRTLARYFMLSLTYNMRGVNNSVRKNGYY